MRRERDSEDERSVRSSLTGAGRQLRGKGHACREITAKASGLSPEEYRVRQRVVVDRRANVMQADDR